jgi:16S rRNA (uracil1498-N3)-methyltransferase
VVERAHRAPVAAFHAPGAWGDTIDLSEAAAHHASVKRLAPGDPVRLSSGDGRLAHGEIAELSRRHLRIAVNRGSLEKVAELPRVELWAPIGDRDRMLLLAEKAVELGASAWRPVVYRRSRSVSPRGEGDAFREKVRQRMIGALEQSGTAWLPVLHLESTLEDALRAAEGISGIVLDAGGAPLRTFVESLVLPVAVALGPEGGLEPEELARFTSAGWRTASLGANVLRFETAGIAALTLIRTLTR